MSKQLLVNAIQTPDGTVLHSRHRHDYRTHKDANGETYMVDGGLFYQRGNLNVVPAKNLAVYDDGLHGTRREHLVWGTYGKSGDEPLHYIRIQDMTLGHLCAVLTTLGDTLLPILKSTMEDEVLFRHKEDIG